MSPQPSLSMRLVNYVMYGLLALFVGFMCIKSPIGEWMATLWLNNYSDGYVKRGLTGEILSTFFLHNAGSLVVIHTVMKLVLALLSFGLIALLLRLTSNHWLIVSVLLSGFSLQQLAYDVGRFDQINYLLAVFGIFVLIQNKLSDWIKFFVLQALLVVMLLIHEASLLMIMPLLSISLYFFTSDSSKKILLPTIIVTISAIIFASLLLNTNPLVESDLAKTVEQRAVDFEIDDGALNVQTTSLSENIQMTLERLKSKKTRSRFLRLFLVTIPFILVLRIWYKQLRSVLSKKEEYLLFIPALAMLPLFIVGIDFYRWLSMMLLNTTLLFLLVSHQRKVELDAPPKYFIAMIIAGIYSGPFGVSTGMPERLVLIGR